MYHDRWAYFGIGKFFDVQSRVYSFYSVVSRSRSLVARATSEKRFTYETRFSSWWGCAARVVDDVKPGRRRDILLANFSQLARDGPEGRRKVLRLFTGRLAREPHEDLSRILAGRRIVCDLNYRERTTERFISSSFRRGPEGRCGDPEMKGNSAGLIA